MGAYSNEYGISLCIPHKQNITCTSELSDSVSNIDVCTYPNIILKTCKLNNVNRISIGHININSLRNKFDALSEIIKNNIGILMISETKIDDSFPLNEFIIDGYVLTVYLELTGRQKVLVSLFTLGKTYLQHV